MSLHCLLECVETDPSTRLANRVRWEMASFTLWMGADGFAQAHMGAFVGMDETWFHSHHQEKVSYHRKSWAWPGN